MVKDLLTIIIPSYNRGEYISECLDSIFNQKTSYSYHLIIPDDHSTDNSIEIIKEYKAKYPNKITLLESQVNQKLYKNVLRAYEITKTKYFCVLDPDDFWVDKNFIQKGLDFLEQNIDFTSYTTNAYKQLDFDEKTRKPYTDIKSPIVSSFEDFLNFKAVLGWTGATIFRNTIFINGIPEKMLKLIHPSCEVSFRGDSFRNLISLKDGKCYFDTYFSAVYRQTSSGIYAGKTELDRNLLNIRLYVNLFDYFDKKYPELLLLGSDIYKRTISEILSLLSEETDIEKLKNKLVALDELGQIFTENNKLISKTKIKNKKLKYKILFYIHNYCEKKLKRKGIL